MDSFEKPLFGYSYFAEHRSTALHPKRLEQLQKIKKHNFEIRLSEVGEPCFVSHAASFSGDWRFGRCKDYDLLRKQDKQRLGIANEMLQVLEDKGWFTRQDPKVSRLIRSDHCIGAKRRLRFNFEHYPAGFRFHFYEDPNPSSNEHPRYKFFEGLYKFSTENRLLCIQARKALESYARDKGWVEYCVPKLYTPREELEWRKLNCIHYAGIPLDQDQNISPSYYGDRDRNKKKLTNGEIKFFLDYYGKLRQGVVYYNIGNMWWVDAGGQLYNIAAHELFDPVPVRSKKFISRRNFERLKSLIAKEVETRNFRRCVILDDRLKFLEQHGEGFYANRKYG